EQFAQHEPEADGQGAFRALPARARGALPDAEVRVSGVEIGLRAILRWFGILSGAWLCRIGEAGDLKTRSPHARVFPNHPTNRLRRIPNRPADGPPKNPRLLH